MKRRNANRALNTDALLGLLHKETPNYFDLAEVVGKWVWIQFSDKQPPNRYQCFGRAWFSLE